MLARAVLNFPVIIVSCRGGDASGSGARRKHSSSRGRDSRDVYGGNSGRDSNRDNRDARDNRRGRRDRSRDRDRYTR